ncbi:MAG: glutathione S-transferase family protein [Gammaproteobacteria bacterium]
MTNPMPLDAMVVAANATLADANRHRVVQPSPGAAPRFDLYHAGLSVCSQKVRTVLAEKGVPYRSHEMVILNSRGIYSAELTPAENYQPAYVKLRMRGGAQLGRPKASGYSGRSAVETEGFDACVVPTLVDGQTNEVIVDSVRICEYIDAQVPLPQRLIPAQSDVTTAVREQLAIVDGTPHPAVLYGFHPEDDRRPDFIKQVMSDVYELKISALRQLIDENRNDAELVATYEAKISKEAGGKSVARDPVKQHAVRAELQRIIEALDRQLAGRAAPWVCGPDFTLADVFWGVSLYRLHWLGLASLWSKLPRVAAYTQALYQRPSLRAAVLQWPSPMPASPHTADVV